MPNATYTIRSGETLSRIATALGTTVEALCRENGISDPNRIAVGQVLRVPGGGGGAGPAPADTTTAGNDWQALVDKHGDAEAKANLAAGKTVILALRKPTNTKANRGHGVYDDRMIVLRRNNGTLQASEFACNTEPSGQYGFGGEKHDTGVDVNRDGKVDQGRLQAGTYHYEPKPGGFLNAPAFRCRSNQTAQRDVNQDGDFNERDGPLRIDPAGVGRTMYVHRGGDDNTWSAGCQTVQKSHYDAFLRAVGGPNASFSYVLVDLDA